MIPPATSIANATPPVIKNYMDLEKGEFAKTTAADLEQFFDSLRAKNTKKLVLHFHGGLVSRSSAHASAATLDPIYSSPGTEALFMIWNSDLKTTLKDNLAEIAAESIFWTIVSRIYALLEWKEEMDAVPTRGARGRARIAPKFSGIVQAKRIQQSAQARETPEKLKPLTSAEEREARELLMRDPILRRQVQQITPARKGARGASGGGRATRMSPSIVRKLQADQRPGARSVTLSPFFIKKIIFTLIAIVRRLRRHTGHGVYVTIVEEVLRSFYVASVGRAVWKSMKGAITRSFGTDPTKYGGTALVNSLKRWTTPERDLLLVGHSAGSIYILELAAKLAEAIPNIKVEVVFMAPACTMELMSQRQAAFEQIVSRSRIYSLSDPLEHGYFEVPVIYGASLLYLISGILEDRADTAVLGMQRYFSGKKPYTDQLYRTMLALFHDRVCYSPSTSPPQLSCTSRRHGGFDENADMQESLKDIALRGIQ